MNFDEYQQIAKSTAIYPVKSKLIYPALGLAGEAGEVAEKIKKKIRDGETDNFEQELAKELGDVLWYISAIASDLGYDLSLIAQMNINKLQSRQQRNTLQGSGDNR